MLSWILALMAIGYIGRWDIIVFLVVVELFILMPVQLILNYFTTGRLLGVANDEAERTEAS